jgi:predicted permease
VQKNVKMLVFSIIKLIVIPVIGVWLLHFFVKDRTLLGVCFVMIATPVGIMTAMFAEAFDGDKETASKTVAFTTLLSVLTIPLIGVIFRSIL